MLWVSKDPPPLPMQNDGSDTEYSIVHRHVQQES
jgi:hypothetical protein